MDLEDANQEAELGEAPPNSPPEEGSPDRSCEIRAEIAPCITFASHQCDVPVVADLVIANRLGRDLEDLTLHLSAEPKVIAERTWTIDRIPAGAEFRPRDRRVALAAGLLESLTERVRADIRLELRQGDELLAELVTSIQTLARNEWGGSRYMPELLAAFVTPNDPAVQRLLRDASKLLESSGKLGSLEGYQSKSRKRSWEIVAGIWAAVTRRALTYAEPPASFETAGQKIRLPAAIEEHGLATCLDTALFFAAAIEQSGLYPVVVFTKGHALCGAWLQPKSLPSLTVDDPMEIRKAIDLKELVLFETTMATAGSALPFSKAVAEGRRQIDEANEANFIYALDIRQARGRDIQPLSSAPSSSDGAAGTSEAARSAAPIDEAPDLPPFDTEAPEEAPQTPEERLERWKRSLLDLSKRNRLLNLKPSATAIPIFCPDPAKLEDKIADGKKRIQIITPPPRRTATGEPDPTLYHLRTGDDHAVRFAQEALERSEIVANVDQKALDKGAVELYRKAKADIEEGGSNTLFLALGMLRWSPNGDLTRSFRAPLILLPVKLERRSAASKPYLTKHDDEPVFNLTLLQMLRQDFQIEIPEVAGELPKDESGIHVRKIWESVRACVRDVPGFEVVEDVVLSTFSFAKYLMWKDLADRAEALKQSPFVRHLIDNPQEPYQGGAQFLDPRDVDRKIDPSELMAPLNADSSQIVAIHSSANSGDFVLEGPPGTGKSETIGNIIAHNIGLGRRVLFVSEKMAALDVVSRRLKACGLKDFCLELHSAKANKRAVLDQLSSAWDKRDVRSVAEWQKKAGRLGTVRTQLNGLVEALHTPGPGGISPRAAIGRTLRYGDVHRLSLDWAPDSGGHGYAPTPAALEDLEALAKRLGQHFSQLQPEDLASFAGIQHSDWSFSWQAEVVAQARALLASANSLNQRRSDFLARLGISPASEGLEELSALAIIGELIPSCAANDFTFVLRPEARDTIASLRSAADRLSAYRDLRGMLSADYADSRITAAPLDEWTVERTRAASKMWPLSTMARRKLRNAMRSAFGFDNKTPTAPERDLETLRTLADLQGQIASYEAALSPDTPWNGLVTDLDVIAAVLATGERLREATLRLAGLGHDLVGLRSQFVRCLCEGRELLETGGPLAESARQFVSAHADLIRRVESFCSSSSFAPAPGPCGRDLASLVKGAEAIVARERRLNLWCVWIEARRDAEAAGLGTLVVALEAGAVTHDQTIPALRTAYCRWVAPILIDAHPALKRFSTVQHEDLIRTFRELDRELAAITSDYIRAKLSGEVPRRDDSRADPGFGVLSRELQKKIRHKPVRQLVGEMGAALLKLTPCVMMSPLSVAQYLPVEQLPFDLVVFDEASQITVPDAIGAIARAKRCIVVGDPKQMPPTRFFEKGAEDDENEEARDLESILDEALAARVPHHRLTGHYRSRHESLICFSNHAYYQGALITYPSADTRESAVSFRRVNGIYAKGKARTNEIEAKAVVAELVARLRDPSRSHLSLGVVTLNAEQQRLIEDLLDQERRADPDLEKFFGGVLAPVFVKNLETVQGDERDVVLISIGYGPTEPGARTMSMNFGPLNRQGGERRLNVAITRATTEVVVFASFDSSMIDLTRTSAEAVKDLKHYVDFATRGPVALGEAIKYFAGSHDYDSDFEMAVAEGLRRQGWTIRTQVGVSKFRIDLGIVHPDEPGRFLAGVECDGATYHSSPSARDRDRVRQIILEQLGWNLLRIWSTDYFLDPETAIAALHGRIAALLETERAAKKQAEASSQEGALPAVEAWSNAGEMDSGNGDDEEFSPEDFQGDDDETEKFADNVQVARVSRRADPAPSSVPASLDASRFYDSEYRSTIRAMAEEIIDAEGPITFKQLSDRLARAHGFQRTGKQISSAVWDACRRARVQVPTPDGHKVFWPANVAPEAVVEFRGRCVGAELREWKDIPYPEKLGLVRSLLGSGARDLTRAVAEAIGVSRVTTQFKEEVAQLAKRLA